jgi:hypothetical protein
MSNMKAMLPAITSVSAAALPLYGTCCIGAPVIVFSSSPKRWLDEPLPAEPKVPLPGLAFDQVTSSAADFTGRPGCTTSTLTYEIASVIGAKSRTGS